jgi:uncharacterized protein YcaQ
LAELSAAEARRLQLSAQGFGGPRAGGSLAKLRTLAARLGAYQIDSVNVLVRAHYMPAFSRLGPYPMDVLERLAYDKRELFEYFAHAACYVPMSLHPLYRWRMETAAGSDYYGGASKQVRSYIESVYDFVARNGPVTAAEVPKAGKSTGNWWGWSDGKRAIETLFRVGRVAVAGRQNFKRLYDIPERVIPSDVLRAPTPSPDEAKKQLLVRAAKALGVGTVSCIAGYFYIESWWDRPHVAGKKRKPELKRLFGELVEEGRLVSAAVEGWTEPAYVVPRTKAPAEVHARALVSPFDPIMWNRAPTSRVFGFDYQIEIYVPAPKRVYGYYCLPFLLGDRFVARVDLKADRKTKTLLVPGAFAENGHDKKRVAAELADELRLMASWLELEKIEVGEKGDLVRPLKAALR